MFPSDKEERFFCYMNDVSVAKTSRAYESIEGAGDTDLDAEDANSLLGEGGLLQSGRQVALPGGAGTPCSFLDEVTTAQVKSGKGGGSRKKDVEKEGSGVAAAGGGRRQFTCQR